MCSLGLQAGLFSAVTSAFVILVHSQLQSDPNEETAALLRVLIYKMDNTTFGSAPPTVPQWSGPTHTIVQVQAILYASLATALFSAFLAMLGKQWLNRYASTDMRGSAIERSQNRQRKLDGTVSWYFDYVMESLPLMLQFALLLLGCALSLYLWGINKTIASVVLGVTSFGVAFYACIIIAGTASASCPYQTPGAHALRYIFHTLRRTPYAPRHILHILHHLFHIIHRTFSLAPSILHSAFASAINTSILSRVFIAWWHKYDGDNWSTQFQYFVLLPILLLLSPIWLACDTYLLVRAIVRALARIVSGWFRRARGINPQTTASDLKCISWVLQTSLDKAVHLITLKFLATMTALAGFDPALVSACFDILASRVVVAGGKTIIAEGKEELAEVSALCCLRTLSHLAIVDPTLGVLEDVRQRYTRSFPLKTNFEDFPSCRSFGAIHNILHSSQRNIQWRGYKLPSDDQVTLAHSLAELAHSHAPGTTQSTWHRLLRTTRHEKVPRWILRFALHHLSQDPPPSTSVIADCLSIIAIDLGCTVPNTVAPDERYVSSLITFRLSDQEPEHD